MSSEAFARECRNRDMELLAIKKFQTPDEREDSQAFLDELFCGRLRKDGTVMEQWEFKDKILMGFWKRSTS